VNGQWLFTGNNVVFFVGVNKLLKVLLARLIIAGSLSLLPVANAMAIASMVTGSSFTSADPARTNTYMDAGGTWNGSSEVTNTTGDTFTLTLQNTATGSVLTDSAFDVALSVDVPTGFRLPLSPLAVTVTDFTGTCPVINGVTATQPGGVGTPVTVNFPANSRIEPGCSYNLDLGLTTNNTAPSVVAGFYKVDFNLSYNEIDNTPGSVHTQKQTQNVEVRKGEIALIKTAITTLAGDGDTVEYTVSLLDAGEGGVFHVSMKDVLSADFDPASLTIVPAGGLPTDPSLGNPVVVPYIATNQIVEFSVFAKVAVNPTATSCPLLRNDATATERLGGSSTFFDIVPYDLQNPFLDYSAPVINIPFGATGVSVTVPVKNTGTGIAKNISIKAANLAAYNIVINNVASPNWSYAAGVFTYTGTLAAGVSANIVFTASVSSCPPPADRSLNWIPAYKNACGTDFFPPLRFSSVTTGNLPTVNVTKSTPAGALNIGQAGSYKLSISGNNMSSLPDDGVPTNQDFVVTDTLPLGVTTVKINAIPTGTVVTVNGAPYSAGAPIPDQATIKWRGDRADLLALPVLKIDYTAGVNGTCPAGLVGQNITNTASMDYAACSINNSSSAGFILNENPAGGAVLNIGVGGDGNFETGARDTDGIARNEAREGEPIPFTVNYTFPAGFTGVWSGSSYRAELRSNVTTGVPLVLTDNRSKVHLQISRISDGASVCSLDLNPVTDFTGGDGSGPLVIPDLGSISGCSLPANMQNHTMTLTYSATSPEGNLDVNGNPLNDNNVGAYLENTTLTVNGGSTSCVGNTAFDQAVNVNIERAALGLTAILNNGNPVSVCSVVPATLNIAGPATDTSVENILLQFNDANFEFVDAAGNPGNPANTSTDLSYTGSLTGIGMNGSRTGNDVSMIPASNTSVVNADGSVKFYVRLRDSSVPRVLSAKVDYDSHHTAPDGSPTDTDRDYNVAINASPFKVLTGDLKMNFFPPDIILQDSDSYNFRVQVVNVGTGTAVNARYRITLPAGMIFTGADINPVSPATFNYGGQTIEWDLGDMAAGQVVNINISTKINQTTCFQSPTEQITSQNEWGCGSPILNTATKPALVLAPNQLLVRHDPTSSFCKLCNKGEIHLIVLNNGGVLLTNVNVVENLQNSGLTYVPNSMHYLVDGVAGPAPLAEPVVSGTNGELITWTPAQIPELASLYSAFNTSPNTPQKIEIIYKVQRNTAKGFNEEGLISANRTISATGTYGLFCDINATNPSRTTVNSTSFELPIQQPVPTVTKQARNVDANQPASAYASTVYGGTADDVIWRVKVTNNGPDSRAGLEDLLVNDTIGGNFAISQICNSEANATSAANGVPADGVNCINNPTALSAVLNVADPFGNPGNDEPGSFIDTLQGGETFIYFVGKIQNTCANHTNNAAIQWGCQANSPPQGGITTPASSGGQVPFFSNAGSASLSTAVNPAGVLISQSITGSNSAQPLGSKGILTIRIRNQSGGTVRNIALDDLLPGGYAFDPTLKSAVVSPAFGNYSGMIDTITLTNPQASPENNIHPTFSFSSSTGAPPQNNLLRHGDVLTITLGIIRVSNFDIVADPVVRTENTTDGSDPAYASPLNNALSVTFQNTCGTPLLPIPATKNLSVTVNPADLDIDINPSNPDLIYILSDPTATLNLSVVVKNNGGNDARNFYALVTTGTGLKVTTVPSGCVVTTNPPPRAVWIPALPSTATVYQCTSSNPIPPGQSNTFTFKVQKAGTGADLTFRADVVGEITQADGTPLTFPAPDTATINNTANNYSLDSIRARLIGFNLTKVLQGNCSEDNPPAVNSNVQIGEDCTYRMQAGWFGFATPGFGSIKIQNINITDSVPGGQGYLSENTGNSSAGIGVITTSPAALKPLDQPATISWKFGSLTTDETFSVDLLTRTLNSPLDSSAAPNLQAASRADTLNASFDVVFNTKTFSFNQSTPGYPPIAKRQATVTVTEPKLLVTATVCNESLYGTGPACSQFLPLVNDGNTNHDYLYKISVTNQASSGGVPRAPAYDVVVTDKLDSTSTGLIVVKSPGLNGDGLDNDDDGLIDSADTNGEGSVTGTPNVITFTPANTNKLARINPGQTVTLYYRVDVSNKAAPGQKLLDAVTTRYDSLAGVSGNQNAPQSANSTTGGARVYVTAAKSATIVITNLTAPPDSKGVIALSNTTLGGTAPFVGPQNVSVGEEVKFQFKFDTPVANLRSFKISDTLPAGMTCIEAQTINLDAAPYNAAGFSPGGSFAPVCNGNQVTWDFGNQQLTNGPTYTFKADFIARIDNISANKNGVILKNGGGTGGGGTDAHVAYIDAAGNPASIILGPAQLKIAEPKITLNKSFNVPNADAGDILTVTVTATNTGSAPAYNLRVFDDLAAVGNLTFLNNVGGTDPPTTVDTTTLGANRPVFSWKSPNAIAPGAQKSFTFQVRVGPTVQPLELIDNTIQAAWTSLQNASTALNASGTIGADGSPQGMRTGAIPNTATAPNNYETGFTDNATSVPAISGTKTDLNPTLISTIGSRKHFRLDYVLPEGVSKNLIISDNLAFGGNSYVLEDNAAFPVTVTLLNIVSINNKAPSKAAFKQLPADGSSGKVVWNIGDIVTNIENDTAGNAIQPTIRIDYYARVNNDGFTNAGDTMQNQATLTYRNGETGLSASQSVSTAVNTVVEPLLAPPAQSKTVSNLTAPGKPPTAGDILRYTLTLTASGGSSSDNFSDVFDVSVIDQLSAGLVFNGGLSVSGAGNSIKAPVITGDGIVVPQQLSWSPNNSNASINIAEGTSIVLKYEVKVLDSVQAAQPLTSASQIQWTSLNGIDPAERNGSASPVFNDYHIGPVSATITTADTNKLLKTRLSDTFNAADANVRVGDVVDYELRMTLQEGSSPNVVITDTLPKGLAFSKIVSINGVTTPPYAAVAPFSHSNLGAANVTVSGNPVSGPTTVRWQLGNIVNVADNNPANDQFVIVYRAVVVNKALTQQPSMALTNTAKLDYTTATGPATPKSDSETITLLQPVLTVTKTAAPANGSSVIAASELIDYTVEIKNTGAAPAYDAVVRDVIPVGLRNGNATVTTQSIRLLSGASLPLLAPSYDASTGVAIWNLDTGVANAYTIPAGDTLQIVYRVQAEAGIGAGLTMTNTAQVSSYYSFDNNAVPNVGGIKGVAEKYAPSNIASTTLTTASAGALSKRNPAQLTHSIGANFTYRITVPGTPMPTTLHDVQILDDLSTLPGSMTFVSVLRVPDGLPQTWVPKNTGTPTNLIIQDAATGSGIDIPANKQIAVDVTVALKNLPLTTNVAGVQFSNTASYTFNQVDNVGPRISGGQDTTANMTIHEPLNMVLSTTGPAQMRFGTPGTFVIDVANNTLSNASDAFDLSVTDVLPKQTDGGMCNSAPTGFTAEIRDNANTTVRTLLKNTDYVTSFTGEPACTLTITMQSAAARIEPGNHVHITYQATLDVDSVDNVNLTSRATPSQWFSANTPNGVVSGEIRRYSNGVAGATANTDTVTVNVLAATLATTDEVFNITSNTAAIPNVILQAKPAQRMRYTITVTNTGRAPISGFSVTDELDRLATSSKMFLPGSMTNFVLPAGADNSNTNSNAGKNNAGKLDVRNLSLGAAGGANDRLVISFEATIRPVLNNGTLIPNQAITTTPAFSTTLSDDPNFPGANNPTRVMIGSAPVIRTLKTAQDMTGNPDALAAGDTLRYTLRAQNTGAEDSVATLLRDQIPANTTYVAGSTTLNGVALTDPSKGVSPVEDGLLIHAPENSTAGFMQADSRPGKNTATITFDVVLAKNIINGTVISNQAFVSGTGIGGVAYPDQPSDDPATELVNDPTIRVVGKLAILKIQKTVDFVPGAGGDLANNGVIDPGDHLRYRFFISNSGSMAATNVLLRDVVPLNSSYIANSTTINGVAQVDTLPGILPLIAGVNVSSTPSPAFPRVGVMDAGKTATVQFDVTVTGVPGQLISNQATLSSNELPPKLSDSDGNDGNGAQPTVVVIGSGQQLRITKAVSVVGGGVALPGKQLEYVIRVHNIGNSPATDIVINDTLPPGISLLAGSVKMNGTAAGVTVLGSAITANYASVYNTLDAGKYITLRFNVTINPTLSNASSIINSARVDWNAGSQNASDSASIDVGGAPGVANTSGSAWIDTNFNNTLDNKESVLPGWLVDIYLRGSLLDTVTTDDKGVFHINGMLPGTASGAEYEFRYRAPGAGPNTAALGKTDSIFTNGLQRISNIVVASGSNTLGLNLPIDPDGVVYNSVLRTPVAGVRLTLVDQTRSNQEVPLSCFMDPNQQNQVTLAQGYYKFNLNFSDSTRCAVNDEYVIQVAPPSDGFVGTTSVIIPPVNPINAPAMNVPACPGSALDKIPATTSHCEVSTSSLAPATSIAPRTAGTSYYLKVKLNNVPSTDQLYNNHIPVDPTLNAAVAISKIAGMQDVTRSQLVPYTITLSNSIGVPLQDLEVIDQFPAGFKYVSGSTRIDGVQAEPLVNHNQMIWKNLSVNTNQSVVIKMLLVVGSGVGEGEYVNTASVINERTGQAASGVASATVRVIPDPTFDCSDVIGKVFNDKNLNGYQDQGEKGIAGVQLATARGLRVTTDDHGRFHITCAVVANETRGSNFIIKMDERSLPSGYRLTTENPRVQRATRGKMLKFNFGATLYRVVKLDLADGVFKKGKTRLRPQWVSRINLLLGELKKSPSILRLSYLGENETESLAENRLHAIKKLIEKRWEKMDCCYRLTIETELFWRRGKPFNNGGFKP